MSNYKTIQLFEDVVIKYEEDKAYIGRFNTNQFILVPHVAGVITEKLKECHSVEEIEKYTESIGLEIDLNDYLTNLIKLGYVKKANEKILKDVQNHEKKGFTFKWIKQKHTKWLINKFVLIIMISTIVIALVTSFFNKKYNFIPSIEEVFWSNNLLLVVISIYIIDILLITLHEFTHFITLRSFGNSLGYISLGRRLTHLVFQTKVENIWLLARKERYIVYLSGLFFDIFILSFITILSNFTYESNIIFQLLRLIALLIILGILFEFKFYMKTDIYFFISDFIKNPTLFEESIELFKNIINKNFPSSYSKSVYIYAIFMILGSFIDILLTIFYLIPGVIILLEKLKISFNNNNSVDMLANSITIIVLLVEFLLVIYIYIKERKNKVSST